MTRLTLRATARAEWVKFRTVPSTLYSLLTMFALTIGLGELITWAIANHYHKLSLVRKATFDQFSASLPGIFFAQFVVGVVAAMIITNEYTNGSIRTTLTAVPRRTLLVAAKTVVMVVSILIVSVAVTVISFLIGQAILRGGGAPTLSIASPGVLRALLLGGIYLTLLGVVAFGLGLIVRRTPAAISIFVAVVLVVPLLVAALPSDYSGPIERFLPSDLGQGMMSLNQGTGLYPPFGCATVLLTYAIATLAIGTYLLNVRDA